MHLFGNVLAPSRFWDNLVGRWTGQTVTRQFTRAFLGLVSVDEFAAFPSIEQKS